jgi:hypothetical protein
MNTSVTDPHDLGTSIHNVQPAFSDDNSGWHTVNSTPPARRPKRDVVALISAVAGVVGVLVAVFAWRWPAAPPSTSGTTTPATTTTAVTTTTPAVVVPPSTPAAPPPTAAAQYLDELPVERGAGDLTEMPRQLRGKSEYQAHPIVLACPSNRTGDKANEVVWRLDRNYAEFHAEVRPFYPAAGEQRAVTYVTAMKGVQNRDTSNDVVEAGSQKTARPGGNAPLTADLAGGDTLIVRVECQYPSGTVVLTDARLVPVA